jgi:hypothetical protein
LKCTQQVGYDTYKLYLYVYLGMKSKLNLTIEDDLLRKAKQYARKKDTSISAIVEAHFRSLTTETARKSLLSLIDGLPPSGIKGKQDLKALYYKEKGGKRG